MDTIARQPRPLGTLGQKPLRELEQQTRVRTLALCRCAAPHGISVRGIADRVGVAHQTLSDWHQSRVHSRLVPAWRGRPRHAVSVETVALIDELLDECRGRMGVPALKACFADVPRTALADLRDQYRSEHDGSSERLTWSQPGTVWAADFTEPELPIEGVYPYVLSVRDLASNYQLLALPVRQANACATAVGLKYLFAAWGLPLVLKTDNGSHFIDGDIRGMLLHNKIVHLLSPPMTPRYNGGIEAGNGAVKLRAMLVAGTHGRSDCWTMDGVEMARREANAQARPWGRNGASPEERWNNRTPISPEQRAAFGATVALHLVEELEKMTKQNQPQPGLRPAVALNDTDRATVARRSVRRALLDLGLLFVRRIAN
jgi:transposase InsO family protein